MWRGFFQSAIATAAFGVLHSTLASRVVKTRAAGLIGDRNCNGLYRTLFNTQAALSSGLLVAYVATRPGRELYHARGPAGIAMRTAQAASLGMVLAAAHRIGIARFGGLQSFSDWLGNGPVRPSPEAQGPAPGGDGRLQTGGPFRLSRHPTNFWALPVIWLSPRMTTQQLAFNIVATAYFVIGSKHEERRLLAAYGQEYIRYRHSGVPFYVPQLSPLHRRNLAVTNQAVGTTGADRNRTCTPFGTGS